MDECPECGCNILRRYPSWTKVQCENCKKEFNDQRSVEIKHRPQRKGANDVRTRKKIIVESERC